MEKNLGQTNVHADAARLRTTSGSKANPSNVITQATWAEWFGPFTIGVSRIGSMAYIAGDRADDFGYPGVHA